MSSEANPSRIVLITGGSRGIGLSCARTLQHHGDRVFITYKNTAPESLDGAPGTHPLTAIRCDVTNLEDVESCFHEIEERAGNVETLVCSAGITDDALLLRMTEDRWARVLETNLTACFRVTKRAISGMIRARQGRVVLIGSVVGMLGNAGQTNYSASKAGLIGFARALSREVASRGITVNVVAPGLIATDMTTRLGEAQIAGLSANIPLGRLGTADEVAAAVAFLAGPLSGYITGAVLAIDGGLGMGY